VPVTKILADFRKNKDDTYTKIISVKLSAKKIYMLVASSVLVCCTNCLVERGGEGGGGGGATI